MGEPAIHSEESSITNLSEQRFALNQIYEAIEETYLLLLQKLLDSESAAAQEGILRKKLSEYRQGMNEYIQRKHEESARLLIHEFNKVINVYAISLAIIQYKEVLSEESLRELEEIHTTFQQMVIYLLKGEGFEKSNYDLVVVEPKLAAAAKVSDNRIQFTKYRESSIPNHQINISILRTQLLIFNIIANAERELQKSERKELTFEIEPTDTCLLIVIADSGNGKLQAKHFQGTTEYAGKGGHGIGLAASLETVIDANGRIDVVSQGAIVHMEDMTDTRSPVITTEVEQKLAGTETGTTIIVTLPYAS